MTNVLVNEKKVLRAKEIIDLLSGVAKNEEEARTKERWQIMVDEAKVKQADYLEFIYDKLGGLIRTPAEQKIAESKAKEMKAKYNKKTSHNDED